MSHQQNLDVRIETVIAKKNHYKNIKGDKKVKVLTRGKKYSTTPLSSVVNKLDTHSIAVVNDEGIVWAYRSNLFFSISSQRMSKLKEIGL